MITQLFKFKSTQRRHLEASLLQVRIRFLSMKSEQGLCQEHLKDWARLLLAFVSCYNLQDGSTTRIALNEVVSKAELWAKSISKKSSKEKTHQMVLNEEKFVVRSIDFLEYIGLLDIRYYDNVVNLLVERKFDKVKLIVAPFFQERVSFLNEYRLSGHKKETLRRYAQYQIHLIEFWDSKIPKWLLTKRFLQQQRNGRIILIQVRTRNPVQNGMIHFLPLLQRNGWQP